MLMRKQRRRYSGESISNLRVYLCAQPMKINGSSQRITTLVSREAFTANTSPSQAFIGKSRQVRRKILLDRRLRRRQHTRGVSSTTARSAEQCSERELPGKRTRLRAGNWKPT